MQRRRTIIGILVTGVLLIGGIAAAAPASAAEAPAAATSQTDQLENFAGALSGSAGNMTFDAAKAAELGGDPLTIKQFAVGIIAAGGTVINLTVDPAAVAQTRAAIASAQASAANSCAGENNTTTQWFGWQVKIDSCNASTLVAAIAGGAATATVAALLTSWTGVGGISAGAIAALLALGAGIVGTCAAAGNGLILDLAWTATPWCAGQ